MRRCIPVVGDVRGVLTAVAIRSIPRARAWGWSGDNRRDPRIQNAYGIALQQKGQFNESLVYFRAALRLDRGFADAAHNLALSALLTVGRPAEALETLKEHQLNTADHHSLKGSALNALGRPAEAIVSMRRAVELEPANEDYAYDLAGVLPKLEKAEAASAVLRKALKLFPASARMHSASGMLAYLTGRNTEAAREYETANKIEPRAADLWAALADVYSATGNLAVGGYSILARHQARPEIIGVSREGRAESNEASSRGRG